MKVIYIHPAIRKYRLNLFMQLSNKLGIKFFWSAKPKIGFNSSIHEYNEILDLLNNTGINCVQGNEVQNFLIDNFSFDLLKLPFQGYKIFIFSNITGVPYLILAPLLKFMGKKIIVFDELWRYPKEVNKYKKIYPYVKFLTKYCLDGVVAAGSKAKEFYVEEFGFDDEKIEVAYNTTVDTKDCVQKERLNKNIKEKLENITTKKKILYLGRIVKYKGLDLLIKAMQDISEEYDLLVVGDGEFKKECEELVNEMNLNARVIFLGSCLSDEAPYYYKNIDIFVLPTRFNFDANVQMESWGFTVNEAMALEVPVVTTTAVGSGFDLIVDGVTGGLAVAGNKKSLSEKINYIIENNKDNKIGKKAREHLLKICNYEDNYLAYENIIKKVLHD